MTVDLVWIVGGTPDAPDRDELRYSIRSAIHNFHFQWRDTFIVGDIPKWFGGAKMPLEPKAHKWDNQRASLTAYLNYPGAADEIIVMNDDMYALSPLDALPTYRNKARASQWNTNHPKHGPNCWTCAVKTCAAWMADKAGHDIHLYECHTPLRFSVPRLRELINEYPEHLPFMVGEAYALAGLGGEGIHAGNAKVKAADALDTKLALPMEFISGNPDSWTGPLGQHIRALFNIPTPIEQ